MLTYVYARIITMSFAGTDELQLEENNNEQAQVRFEEKVEKKKKE